MEDEEDRSVAGPVLWLLFGPVAAVGASLAGWLVAPTVATWPWAVNWVHSLSP